MTQPSSAITPEIVADHGLSPEEYDRVLNAIGREPNLVELGIFSVMWSEHCSYKSSRIHLKKLPTEAPWVIRSEEHTSELQSLMRISYAVFCLKKKNYSSHQNSNTSLRSLSI